MLVKVKFRGKSENVELGGESNVENLLEKIEINPETVLVKRDKEIITEGENLKDRDSIELIRIISGG